MPDVKLVLPTDPVPLTEALPVLLPLLLLLVPLPLPLPPPESGWKLPVA